MKTEKNCLAHAVVIAVAKVTNDPDYNVYGIGIKKTYHKIHELLQVTVVHLSRGGGIPELAAFHRRL